MADDGRTINLTDRNLDDYDFEGRGWEYNFVKNRGCAVFRELLSKRYIFSKSFNVWHSRHVATGEEFFFAGNRRLTVLSDSLSDEFEAMIVLHFGA